MLRTCSEKWRQDSCQAVSLQAAAWQPQKHRPCRSHTQAYTCVHTHSHTLTHACSQGTLTNTGTHMCCALIHPQYTPHRRARPQTCLYMHTSIYGHMDTRVHTTKSIHTHSYAHTVHMHIHRLTHSCTCVLALYILICFHSHTRER